MTLEFLNPVIGDDMAAVDRVLRKSLDSNVALIRQVADYIIAGCAIFEAISNVWPTGEITIADRGVREGIIISLLQGKA